MAIILAESFEWTGYEGSWIETVSPGCTLNPDSSIPTPVPNGAGSQCLRATTVNANDNANANQIINNQNISYVRTFIYLTSMDSGSVASVIRLITSFGAVVAGIQMQFSSPNYQLRFQYYSEDALNATAWVNIALNTWYRIEFRYDITNMLWSWRINGTSQHSGSLGVTIRTPNQFRIGIMTGASNTNIYHDLAAWDDAAWVGTRIPRLIDEAALLADFLTKHLGTTQNESISIADAIETLVVKTHIENMTLSDIVEIGRIFLRDLSEDISLNDTITKMSQFFSDESVSLIDMLNIYAFRHNSYLKFYQTKMLVDFSFSSGTKRFTTEDTMITD